jgi:hypothetical protein
MNIPTQLRALAAGLATVHARMASKKEGRSWKTWGTIALCAVLVASFAQMGTPTGQEATLTAPTQVPILRDGKQVGSATLPVGAKVSILKEDRPSGKVLIKANLGQGWVSARNVGFDWGVEEPPEPTMDPAKVAATTSSPKRKNPSVKKITLKYGHQYWEHNSKGKPTKLVMIDEGTVVEPIAEEAGEFLYLYKGHELWTTRDGQYKHSPPSGPDQTIQTYYGPIRAVYGLRATAEDVWEAVRTGSPLGEAIRALGSQFREKENRVAERLGTSPMKITLPHETMEEVDICRNKEEVSLRPLIESLGIKVEYQEQGNPLHSCALFAVGKALEFEAKKSGLDFKPSLEYLNEAHGTRFSPEGTSVESTIEGLTKQGIPTQKGGVREGLELTWRPVLCGSNSIIPLEQFSWKTHMDIRNQLIMEEIRKGRVVIAGGMVKQGQWTQTNKSPVIPHAFLIVGFKTKDGTPRTTSFEVLNSWGTHWGKQGYGQLSGQHPMNVVCSIALGQ